MGSDYLVYWKWDDFPTSWKMTNGTCDYAGSDRFDNVGPGDTLWIVTVPKKHGKGTGILTLLGRIKVGRVLIRDRAADLRGIDRIWDRKYHALAEPGTEMFYVEIPLPTIVRHLRFQSTTNDRIAIGSDGSVDGGQLQTKRTLTPTSVALIQQQMDEYEADRRALEAQLCIPISSEGDK